MDRIINMDFGWHFFKGDLEPQNDVSGWGGAKAKAFGFGAASMGFDDSGWKVVNIPHDFVVEGNYTKKQETFVEYGNIPAMETIDNRHVSGGSLEGGIGWYRKKFFVPRELEQKRIYLYFDGIYRDSIVFLNQYDIGRHASGYTSFYYDVTEFLHYGEENLLAVRVDATGREGWWYEGGGIYRHVSLLVAEPIHVSPWGIYASTKLIWGEGICKKAVVQVETELVSREVIGQEVTLETAVVDDQDRVLDMAKKEVRILPWENNKVFQELELDTPHLWDIEDPYRYRIRSRIYKDGAPEESRTTFFGVRDIYFDENKGFYLNGRNIKIKGVCCHQDHAGLGIAVPDSIFEVRLRKIKEMGGNALRCSHHPPASVVLDLCDRMGFLVIDETRKLSSSIENINQIRSMIRRDRNHPSIIMWSIGNEETGVQDKEEGGRLAKYVRMEIKRLDRTRPVTMAFCGWNGEYFHDPKVFFPVSKELDVMGFNYMPEGWDEYHEIMKDQPIIITEASTNSGTRGCYETDALRSAYYILDPSNEGQLIKKDVAEMQWKKAAESDFVSGIFLWTGFDYRGEPTPFSYPAVYSQFGIMDACGFPKDNFYYYQSWWSDQKVLHLFPGMNFPDHADRLRTVYCYSNAAEVELFVNGMSQGRKRMEKNWYLEWEKLVYQAGELYAVGYWEDGESRTKEIKAAGRPEKILLQPDRREIECGGVDAVLVTVKVVDSVGEVVPESNTLVRFRIEGDGIIMGVGNGDPGSHESDKEPMRRVFHGLCQIIVCAGKCQGTIHIKAYGDGLCSGECSLAVIYTA
nr:glycoside hydrolase family 2 TIM barrel-domain containing protein [uncultured Acetatifactor sp.]